MPVDTVVTRGVQQLVMQLVFGGAVDGSRYLGDRPELPGPLAVTLSRRTLRIVQTQEYYVCEKSDGERAMLLLLGKGTPFVPAGGYLVDRSFAVHTFPRAGEYAAMCAPAGPTLMDGELILRAHDRGTGTGNALYMIFDLIAANGAATGALHFDRRAEAIGHAVRVPFRNVEAALARAGGGGSGCELLPLYLMGKSFVPAARVAEVLACIHAVTLPLAAADAALTAPLENEDVGVCGGIRAGSSARAAGSGAAAASSATAAAALAAATAVIGGHREYRCGQRVNGTDGLVFTPIRCSYTGQFASGVAALPLLKWKFADENTVDFRLRRGDLEADTGGGAAALAAAAGSAAASAAAAEPAQTVPLFLSAGGGGHDVGVARTALSLAACDAYCRLMDRLGGLDSLIVEAAYDAAASVWRLRRVRNRKTRANHVSTGWATLEVVAENITAEELTRSLGSGAPAPPGAGHAAPAAAAVAAAGR